MAEHETNLRVLAPTRTLPPVFVNRMPWTKGYFSRVDHGI